MSDALRFESHFSGFLSKANKADCERLMRFLPQDEPLIWIGSPQLSRLFLRVLTLTALMALIASGGIYFVIRGLSLYDICGPDPDKTCVRIVMWPWLGLFVAVIYTPFLWLAFLTHASGLLREFYGLTDRQALRLRSTPFDRFQSVKLEHLAEHQIAVRKKRGTITFGSVKFLCLSDVDAGYLCGLLHSKLQTTRHAEAVLHNRGTTS